jgi:adenosylhomocysteinase
MPYHFHDEQLRVFRKFSRQERNSSILKGTRFIVNQHLVKNTLSMLNHVLAVGAEITCLVAKPYSIDPDVSSSLSERGIPIINESYSNLETTDILDKEIAKAVEKSKVDGKKIIIWDVGGYFALPLVRLPGELVQHISGVVEDTTFGHNRYLEQCQKIDVPIFSVARSALKEVEARYVGRDAIEAIGGILRKLGIISSGRNALVLGYGMIGKNVARSLAAADFKVSVYDRHDHLNLRAFIDGFAIHKKRELIKQADVIFSATATQAMSFEDIEECKNNVLLVSVGSKDTEFDVRQVAAQSLERQELGSNITKYVLPNSKSVLVARDGTAVNFLLDGQPDEIMDLVFTEILLCTMKILKTEIEIPLHLVHSLDEINLNFIAKEWLRGVN